MPPEDDFDQISDDMDYTAINDQEWDIYESQPSTSTAPPLNSYNEVDDHDHDHENDQFYAELDELERSWEIRKLRPADKGKEIGFSHICIPQPDPMKDFEEEMSCPICFELVVYAHAVNPCGHTICGSCGASWFIDNKKSTCPMCRSQTECHRPMIPNVAVDGIVRKYVNITTEGDEEREKLKKDFSAREWKWKLKERRVRDEFERRCRIVSATTFGEFTGPLAWWMRLNRAGIA